MNDYDLYASSQNHSGHCDQDGFLARVEMGRERVEEDQIPQFRTVQSNLGYDQENGGYIKQRGKRLSLFTPVSCH